MPNERGLHRQRSEVCHGSRAFVRGARRLSPGEGWHGRSGGRQPPVPGIGWGAEPHEDEWCGSLEGPCHFWNVADGAGAGIERALYAIIEQATPLPCEFDVSAVQSPPGETLVCDLVNVSLADASGTKRLTPRAPDLETCPEDELAWSYDDPDSPQLARLCPAACAQVVDAEVGSRLTLVLGCQPQIILR